MLMSFISLVGFMIASRVIPHPPNFTPVLGMAVFAPYLFREMPVAVALPITAMVISDLLIGFHSSMFWVYGCIAVIAAVSYRANMSRPTALKTAATASVATFVFFAVTNFGVWLGGGLYPHTLEGLIACYIAALPFYGNTVLSTALFSALFYGLVRLIEGRRANARLSRSFN